MYESRPSAARAELQSERLFLVIIARVHNFNDPPDRFLNQAATWAMTNASNVWFTVLPNRATSLLFASKKA
jgi:hypothetical protein